MNEYAKQLKKKWATLLLLFLFPLLLIGMIVGLLAVLLIPDENTPIQVALVDEDLTKESKLISTLLTETASGQHYLQIVSTSKKQAQQMMDRNEISTYFSLPKDFTDDLYEGESVTIPMTGNPLRPIDSYITKELVDSFARYIAAAQANILVINEFAKETAMSKDERMEFMYGQFIDFTLYTLGKDRMLDEEVIMNAASSSPRNYYLLAGWFIALSIWLLSFYSTLGKEETKAMATRMTLSGVTLGQRITGKVIVSFTSGLILASILFALLRYAIQIEFFLIDYVRFGLFTALYAAILLIGIALIDIWVSAKKTALFLGCIFVFISLLLSGALIPTLYFPQSIQTVFPYFFSSISLNWMMDLVLEERNYANFTSLTVYFCFFFLLLLFSFSWKERWRQ